MRRYVIMKAYDGSIARVDVNKVDEFKAQQEKIKLLLNSGKSFNEILVLIKEGELNEH